MTSALITTLTALPAVTQVQPYHFFDPQHQPTRCDLLLHRVQQWVIATDRLDNPGLSLLLAQANLAAKICTEFQLQPQHLVLLTRYAHGAGENFYSAHFRFFDRDLFGCLRFLEPSRRALHPVEVVEVLTQVVAGEPPPPELRAIST